MGARAAPSAARALASSATSSANVSLAGASVTSADRGRLIGRRVGSVRADDSGALGRDEEAKRRAADFLRRDDDSPHAAKVRASCGGPR